LGVPCAYTAQKLSKQVRSKRIAGLGKPHFGAFATVVARLKSGWKCLKVVGPLDLSLTGILVSLLGPLVRAGISVFALSAFDTDYLLVKTEDLASTARILSLAGHQVLGA
jgi:hypothetical protein